MPETEQDETACAQYAGEGRIPPEFASAVLALGRKLRSAVAKVNQAQRELGEVKALHDKLIEQLTIE